MPHVMHLTTRAQEPDFRRWYENLAIGSEITVKEAAKSLYRFLRMHEDTSTPMVLVEIDEKDRREVEDILQDFVARLRARVRELYCDCARIESQVLIFVRFMNYFTISMGFVQRSTTFLLTLPRSQFFIPLNPRLPMTIRSTFFSSAISTIFVGTYPLARNVVTVNSL